MNQMLITVSTRKFERSVRLPEGDVPVSNDSGLSKSAASWSFVALSVVRLKEWMARDLSGLGLLVIQIEGIHMAEDRARVRPLYPGPAKSGEDFAPDASGGPESVVNAFTQAS